MHIASTHKTRYCYHNTEESFDFDTPKNNNV